MTVVFDSRLVLIAAFVIACLALPGVYHVILPRSQVPVVVPASPTSSYDLGESLALVTPVPVVPLVEEPVFIVPDPSEAISTTESSLSPVPSASSRGSTSAIASTYFSFSNMVLRDLQDVMRVIDEILAFLRNQTLADAKRTMLEYWAYVLADRHKRAKSNARKLWSRARGGVV
ncbi:hypothetical protein M408DRAFT_326173 [Serendipita vermifera MAFF 305830]|uniref:Uncharacterized protein n=1 Tax=Serendipita vermifera MAFF 305830 TaxID=933852 RepID=A0A0C3B9G2_SERVB|nr:hypothetical protein M408DRAFT_326173 [Serendipita vermifera MAFF 305830]